MTSAFGVEHEIRKGLGRGRIGSQSAVKLRALSRAAKRNYLNDPIMADEAARVPRGELRRARYSAARLENNRMHDRRGGPEHGSPYQRMRDHNKQSMTEAVRDTPKRKLP